MKLNLQKNFAVATTANGHDWNALKRWSGCPRTQSRDFSEASHDDTCERRKRGESVNVFCAEHMCVVEARNWPFCVDM